MMKITVRSFIVVGALALGAFLVAAPAAKAEPTAQLLVTDTDEPNITVLRDDATAAGRVMFNLENNGNVNFAIKNNATNKTWYFANRGSLFTITEQSAGEPPLFRFLADGTFRPRGTVEQGSSREWKEQIKEVNERAILDRLVGLQISEWQYSYDADGQRHVGPMAEDFHEAFGLNDGKFIGLGDAQGVLMAAVKGLHQVVEEKDSEIESLKKQNQQFAERLAKIEENLGQD